MLCTNVQELALVPLSIKSILTLRSPAFRTGSVLNIVLTRFGWEADPLLPPGFLRKGTEYYTPENQRVDGIAKMLEWLLDRGYPFTVTSPLAREINWAKLKVERRLRLQGLLNLQMMREGVQETNES